MSNFEKILEFNKAFSVITNKTPKLDIFDNKKLFYTFFCVIIK